MSSVPLSDRRATSRVVALGILLAFGAPTSVLAQGSFNPVEIQVTPDEITDLEFQYDGRPRFTWIEYTSGDVWIGDVDPTSGGFVQPDAKGILLDTGGDIPGNGSEWVWTVSGPRVVYNRQLESGTLRMAQAVYRDGTWSANDLPMGASRLMVIGSTDPYDPDPRILYLVRTGQIEQIGWRYLDDFRSEALVPSSAGATGARWVPGQVAMVYSADAPGGGRQAFHYDGLTGQTTQLTFDSGRKVTVFMWPAPEYPGEFIFFTSVREATSSRIDIYRLLDEDQDGAPEWTVIKTIRPARDGLFYWSPEFFVHNGKSYIFTQVSASAGHGDPSQIVLLGIDPQVSFVRNLSEPGVRRLRVDPEVFISEQGPMIYYNRYLTPSTGWPDPVNNEGIFRVHTGLGPPSP